MSPRRAVLSKVRIMSERCAVRAMLPQRNERMIMHCSLAYEFIRVIRETDSGMPGQHFVGWEVQQLAFQRLPRM